MIHSEATFTIVFIATGLCLYAGLVLIAALALNAWENRK